MRTGKLTSIGDKIVERFVNLPEDFVIERLLQAVILRMHAAPCNSRRYRRIVENGGKVEPARFPMILPEIHSRFHIQHVDAANHLVDRAESQLCHVLPQLVPR